MLKPLLIFVTLGMSSLGRSEVQLTPQGVSLSPSESSFRVRFLQHEENLILQQNCRIDNFDLYQTYAIRPTNTLEFGLRVFIPQQMPANGDWFLRYNCQNPIAVP